MLLFVGAVCCYSCVHVVAVGAFVFCVLPVVGAACCLVCVLCAMLLCVGLIFVRNR